jgi:hypothetical protein
LDAVSVESPQVKTDSEEKNWKNFDPLGLCHIPSWWPDIRADSCLHSYAYWAVIILSGLPIFQHHWGLSCAGLLGACLNP